eukprot:g155.t1
MSLQSSVFTGQRLSLLLPLPIKSTQFRCRQPISASQSDDATVSRRAFFGALAAVSTFAVHIQPSSAAYGQGANIFGRTTDTSGFIPYAGDGFALLIPSKWNPSRERDFPGTIFRYEDNQEPLTHVLVTKTPTDKKSIEQLGTEEEVLKTLSFYIGEQVFKGETESEGGFQKDKVSVASLMDMSTQRDKNGKTYYKYQLLVRAADGNEGGRHVLLTAAVGDGNLYVSKIQCGDKRWFKGADKDANAVNNSFTVA